MFYAIVIHIAAATGQTSIASVGPFAALDACNVYAATQPIAQCGPVAQLADTLKAMGCLVPIETKGNETRYLCAVHKF